VRDRRGGRLVVLRHHVAPLLGVELAGEGSRAHKIAEEDGQLPPLALGRRARERGPAVAAEPLADLVQRPAGGADVAEPSATLRTEAPIRAVAVTTRRAAERVLDFHRLLGLGRPSFPASPLRARGLSTSGRARSILLRIRPR